jgi:hypothetical protein
MSGDEDEFGCDPMGVPCKRFPMGLAPLGSDPYGWEFDGPGRFGGELTTPVLSNWGRYPSRSPLKGIFAGDLTKPILSNWGRYPHGSPLTGVFAGDDDPMVMPMDTITANPSSSGMVPDSNPSTSGLGGILDAVSTVAQGVSSVVAAARQPPPPPPYPGPARGFARPHHHPLRPLPYFNPPPPYNPPPPMPYPPSYYDPRYATWMAPPRRPAGYPPGYTRGVWTPSDPGY